MSVIGFDTSNYTTSIAYFDGSHGVNCSKLLPVKEGALGLRQSDAVFHHTQSLPELSGRLFCDVDISTITAVGVSTRPRAVEGSYMPCFTVGYSHAKMLADTLHVPLVSCSHQQGHIAAALYSAGKLDLLERPHHAWHLSGGTTELLYVTPSGKNVHCECIGGTTDISAGQLIDRTAQLLGLGFPGGKHIDKCSQTACNQDVFKVKCNESSFSLSGIQNKVQKYYQDTESPTETAAFALRCISYAVERATEQAIQKYGDLPVVFSGGVASNSMLRQAMAHFSPIFAQPEYSTDNAMGVAVLAYRLQEE